MAINVGDVDLEACILHIQSKGGGRERVFGNPALVALLAHHLGKSVPQSPCGLNSPVFRSKSGRRVGARPTQLNFARWLTQAGITRPFSLHSLRHTFATRLYRGGLYQAQRALGHRQITTTEIYARVSDEALRRAVGVA